MAGSQSVCVCVCVCTQTAGLDGDVGRVVPGEEGRVDLHTVDQPRYPQLDDAPVVTFRKQKHHVKFVPMPSSESEL